MHAGLSPELISMDQIRNIARPTTVPDYGLLCDLLWGDPDKSIEDWDVNSKGVSYSFGKNIVKKFIEKHNFELICRSHQVVEAGYEFFAKKKLVTIFSAPNYCGEFKNDSAVLCVDDNLFCSFQQFRRKKSKNT